jgi:hypothetical protein
MMVTVNTAPNAGAVARNGTQSEQSCPNSPTEGGMLALPKDCGCSDI